MTDMRLFDNGEFALRITPAGDTFTVPASDLARALGIRDANTLIQSIPETDRGYGLVRTPGGDQNVWFVTEPGFYRAIGMRQAARVKNLEVRESVERFQRWVYADVLPAIRRHGEYRAQGQAEIPAHSEALRRWADEVDRNAALAAKVTELEPIAAQAEFHRSADGLVPVGDFANKLKAWAKETHNVRVIHPEVWDFLAEIRLIIRGDKIRNNRPTAFATDRGFVKSKETEYVDNDGVAHVSISSRLTPAGEGWAWDRAVRRIAEHGSLRPSTELEREAS